MARLRRLSGRLHSYCKPTHSTLTVTLANLQTIQTKSSLCLQPAPICPSTRTDSEPAVVGDGMRAQSSQLC